VEEVEEEVAAPVIDDEGEPRTCVGDEGEVLIGPDTEINRGVRYASSEFGGRPGEGILIRDEIISGWA
jgi:hypothetical protein